MRIGIIGQMRAGKTTMLEYISQHRSNEYLINLRLSDPIYRIARSVFESLDVPWFKNRRLLEGIGEIFNAMPGDGLIIDFMNRLKVIEQEYPDAHLIVDDVRTTQQADALSAIGFDMVRVYASEETRKARSDEREFATGHYSDLELVSYSVSAVLDNNSTLAAFYEQIDKYLKSL